MKHVIFLLGATGVAGSAIAGELLKRPELELKLLIRARDRRQGGERLDALLRFWGLERDAASRIEVVVGDIEQPGLGLAPGDHDRLARSITHIVHAAGKVKLNQPLAAARVTAVEGTRRVLMLARQAMSEGQLRKVDYFSTVGVAGSSIAVVREEQLPAGRRYRNTYEQAKAEAEALVWEQIMSGLPVTIHRPSMIVGDSRDGRILQFQVFYHLLDFLAGLRTRGIVPDPERVALDLIPVDCVAEMIGECYDEPATAGRVFHLSSGAQALPLTQAAETIRAFFREQEVPLPRLRYLNRRWFSLLLPLLRVMAPPRAAQALKPLNYFLRYLESPQVFDNAGYRAFLAGRRKGVPAWSDYLPILLKYYFEQRRNVMERE